MYITKKKKEEGMCIIMYKVYQETICTKCIKKQYGQSVSRNNMDKVYQETICTKCIKKQYGQIVSRNNVCDYVQRVSRNNVGLLLC